MKSLVLGGDFNGELFEGFVFIWIFQMYFLSQLKFQKVLVLNYIFLVFYKIVFNELRYMGRVLGFSCEMILEKFCWICCKNIVEDCFYIIQFLGIEFYIRDLFQS